jgi:hypothetical protein
MSAQLEALPAVQCCRCGRAYAVSRAQREAGVPAHSAAEAGAAARLTGWILEAGYWYCGILDCRP